MKTRKIAQCDNLLDASFSPATKKGFLDNFSNNAEITSKKLDFNDSISLKQNPNLSKKQYDIIRNDLEKNSIKILSSRSLSRYSKTFFENIPIEINENTTSIDPSFMIEESFNLICENQNIKIASTDRIRFVIKWGGDGSNIPEVKFKNDPPNYSDSQIFMVSICPLMLYLNNEKIWQNSKPGSPNFCRPILIKYERESDQSTHEIFNLYSSKLKFGAGFLEKYPYSLLESLPTMIDQKVFNALSQGHFAENGIFKNAASTRCPLCFEICHKIPKDKHIYEKFDIISPDKSKYGLSTLHFLINIVKHLLFKIGRKYFDDEYPEKENIIKIYPNIIKNYNLDLSRTKNGYGTTINGNIARKIFYNFLIYVSCLRK